MAESENIVAETAEKIFADLADAQTINHDKKGEWKAPLWQALSEAGLPLAWVPEDCGGSGASLAEGFARAERRGAFCHRRAAGRNHAGRMAAGTGQDLLARGRDDRGPGKPEGPHHAERRRQPFRPRPRRAVCQGRQTFRGARQRREAACRSRWSTPANAGSRPGLGLGGDNRDTVTLRQGAAGHDQAGAEGFRPDAADADGRRRAQLCRSRARWNRCWKFPCAIPTSASPSRRRSRNSRRCSTIWHGSPASRPRRWRRRLRPPTPSPTRLRSTTKCSSKPPRQRSAARKLPKKAARIAHQVHGAIGFTIEHILHRYSLRALAWRDDFGSESYWAVELGKLVADQRRR